jgi:hypothetical protein
VDGLAADVECGYTGGREDHDCFLCVGHEIPQEGGLACACFARDEKARSVARHKVEGAVPLKAVLDVYGA